MHELVSSHNKKHMFPTTLPAAAGNEGNEGITNRSDAMCARGYQCFEEADKTALVSPRSCYLVVGIWVLRIKDRIDIICILFR